MSDQHFQTSKGNYPQERREACLHIILITELISERGEK